MTQSPRRQNLRPTSIFGITTRELEVLRVADVTSGMRRITLGGAGLAAHTAANGYPVAAFRSDGFDDEFKILLKHPDAAEVVVPTQADGVLNWPREDPHLVLRTYTVRRWDPERGELDVDFVKHGVGPATSWAARVQPGERVHIAGPKSSATHPEGVDWTLVAGDETALPAIGRWLETWPVGARGQVFIEIAEKSHEQDLPVPQGVELTWLSRDGAEAGHTTALYDAITAAPWWEGQVYAWVAGEALTLTPIRRWLKNDKGLTKECLDVTGYWRLQQVSVSAADPSLPDLAEPSDQETFHELSELMPGFALRVAATIGLGEALSSTTDRQGLTAAELAVAMSADELGVSKLLRYLETIGIAERDSGHRWRLTALGRQLEDEHTIDELSLDRIEGLTELRGMLTLLAAVRTGRGDHQKWFGTDFTSAIRADQGLTSQLREAQESGAQYLAGPLAQSWTFDQISSIELVGKGVATIADALTQAHPHLGITMVADSQSLGSDSCDAVGSAEGLVESMTA